MKLRSPELQLSQVPHKSCFKERLMAFAQATYSWTSEDFCIALSALFISCLRLDRVGVLWTLGSFWVL